MKLQVKELYGDNKQTFSDVELSLCESLTKGFYNIEFHNEGKKQYIHIKDKEGNVLSYSKNLDVLVRKVLLADQLLSNLDTASFLCGLAGKNYLSSALKSLEYYVEEDYQEKPTDKFFCALCSYLRGNYEENKN